MKDLIYMMRFCKKHIHPSLGLLFVRLAMGSIFLVHGIAKLRDIAGTAAFFDSALPVGAGLAVVFAWVVALVETVGGIAVILGIFARKAAFLLAIVMAVAIIFVKSKMPFAAMELDIALLGSTLGIMFAGAGKCAFGRLICKKSHATCDGCNDCSAKHEHTH